MIGEDDKINNQLLIIKYKYKYAIFNFEKYLEKIYSKISSIRYSYTQYEEGYIINLEDYENLKKNINYNMFNSNYNLDNITLSDDEKIYKIKQIPFKSSQYLINMIYNDNKYIIINSDLWKIICENGQENEPPIKYEINSSNIIIKFNNDRKLVFSYYNNKNIIGKSGFYTTNNSNYESNYSEIEKIYKDIKNYYNFEKEFCYNLKKETKSYNRSYGYLVDKKWVDEWKFYSNYEVIKNYFLEKNKNEKNIKDEIIKYCEINKIQYSKLSKISFISLKKKRRF